MINELIRLAIHLDKKGLIKEADYIDAVIRNYRLTKRAFAVPLDIPRKTNIEEDYPRSATEPEAAESEIEHFYKKFVNVTTDKIRPLHARIETMEERIKALEEKG